MTFSVKDMIRKRKSVRTFIGEPLKNEDRSAIDQFIQSPTNPFDVHVDFRLLDAKEYGLSSLLLMRFQKPRAVYIHNHGLLSLYQSL